jgi:hypothetical protein
MAKPVSKRTYFLPRLIGRQSRSQFSQLRRRFADPLQTTLDGIIGLLVLHERHEVHPGNVRLDGLRVLDDVFQAQDWFSKGNGVSISF